MVCLFSKTALINLLPNIAFLGLLRYSSFIETWFLAYIIIDENAIIDFHELIKNSKISKKLPVCQNYY
jgi:hypothetical protein